MAGASSGQGKLVRGNQPLGQNQFKVVPQRKTNKNMKGIELLNKAGKKFKK